VSTYWKEGIDEFIKAENEISNESKNDIQKSDLTKELAVSM
jgi:hypothetical protein